MEVLQKKGFFKNYSAILYLLGGLILGGLLGGFFPQKVLKLKLIGDVFFNLLLTAVIPLVFFAASSAIANLGPARETGRFIGITISVFTGAIFLAATITILTLHFFPISLNFSGTNLALLKVQPTLGYKLMQSLTINKLSEIISPQNVLTLIIFSMLIGFAARRAGAAGNAFRAFLSSGNVIVKNLLQFIMKLAPLGLGVYFACQLAAVGTKIFGIYTHILVAAHCISLFYYVVVFSGYALIAGGITTVVVFWKNNLFPSVTALATCSSCVFRP